jgi:hypothetical protein
LKLLYGIDNKCIYALLTKAVPAATEIDKAILWLDLHADAALHVPHGTDRVIVICISHNLLHLIENFLDFVGALHADICILDMGHALYLHSDIIIRLWDNRKLSELRP